MKKFVAFAFLLFFALFFLMNGKMIRDVTLDWVDKNPKDIGAPAILLRSAVWCDWTGSDAQALELYQAVWTRYPEATAQAAQALYRVAYHHSQSTARKNANQFLQMIFDQYEAEEKWRVKAVELWDEVNHAL